MARRNSNVDFSRAPATPKPSGGRASRTPFTVNTLLEDDIGSGDFYLPPVATAPAEPKAPAENVGERGLRGPGPYVTPTRPDRLTPPLKWHGGKTPWRTASSA